MHSGPQNQVSDLEFLIKNYKFLTPAQWNALSIDGNTRLNHLILSIEEIPNASQILAHIIQIPGLDWNAKNSREITPFFALVHKVGLQIPAAIEIFPKVALLPNLNWNARNNPTKRTPLGMFMSSVLREIPEALEVLPHISQLPTLDWNQENPVGKTSLSMLEKAAANGVSGASEVLKRILDKSLKKSGTPADSSSILYGGIDGKYLGGRIPELPYLSGESEKQKLVYSKQCQLKPLESRGCSSVGLSAAKPSRIVTDSFEGDYYTLRELPGTNEMLSFFLAGRKEKAFVPQVSNGRCILVVTDKELNDIKTICSGDIDILVVKKITSRTHGAYKDLQLPTSRRLASFLCAYYFNVSSFIMADDNLDTIRFNCDSDTDNDWDNLFKFMLNEVAGKGCVSIKTYSNKTYQEGRLGSKLFMINLAAIKENYPSIEDMFLFFPNADEVHRWGGDYYMQLALHSAGFGFRVISDQLSCLQRSRQNVSVFAKTKEQATPYMNWNGESHPELSHDKNEIINSTINILNGIIEKNYRYRNKRLNSVKRADIGMLCSRINKVSRTPGNQLSTDIPNGLNFNEKFRFIISQQLKSKNIFRPYQLEAINFVRDLNENKGRLEIATGCGKTFIQCALASAAHCAASQGDMIVIITPMITLVDQFYDDFINFNKLESNPFALVPNVNIIKVSSNSNSISASILSINKRNLDQKNIYIFCKESFQIFLKNTPEASSRIRMIFADEYHAYANECGTIIKEIEKNKTRLIGCSATPPKLDPFGDAPNYTYTLIRGIHEQYLAPILVDTLSVPNLIDRENRVDTIISLLPEILNTHYHPGFDGGETLSQGRGVIYFPSIIKSKMAQEKLNQHGISCYLINSKNPKYKTEIIEYLNQDSPGVLLAVEMLGYGFNDSKLSWGLDLRHTKDVGKILQKIGRVARAFGSKIGYFICLDDIYDNLVPSFFKDLRLTQPVSVDYLAQDGTYPQDSNDADPLKLRIANPINITFSSNLSFSESLEMEIDHSGDVDESELSDTEMGLRFCNAIVVRYNGDKIVLGKHPRDASETNKPRKRRCSGLG